MGEKLRVFIKNLNPYSCAILCHHNADPDAICSAYALSKLIKKLLNHKVEVRIIAPEGISLPSRRLIECISEINIYDDFDESDLIFMVDTCTFIQLGTLCERIKSCNIPIIVIDHHTPHSDILEKASLLIIDENASSTSEIICNIFNELGFKIEEKIAFALLIGIIYDSRRFINVSSRTFRIVSNLIDAGANYSEALKLLYIPMDISERIARLKAAQRLKIHRVNNWIIITSHVSSFEASAARALIDLGADVAFVAGGNKSKLRISARSRSSFYNQTKIHLGKDLMEEIGARINGAGGGHATAAGANGIGDPEEVLELCVKLLVEKLGQNN